MKPFRRLATAFWLALVLLVGQQAAALHALAHATEQVQKQDGKPAQPAGHDCFAYASFAGSATSAMPELPAAFAGETLHAHPLHAGAAFGPRLAFRSRAPPHAA